MVLGPMAASCRTLRRLRDRHLRQSDRRLAGITITADPIRIALSADCYAIACRVTDALEQALYERRPTGDLVHHSDRGSQYVSIRYTERLAEAGIEPSVGSVGDSYDNALAETIIGLFKAEIIHRSGPWKTADAVEWETLKWPYGV